MCSTAWSQYENSYLEKSLHISEETKINPISIIMVGGDFNARQIGWKDDVSKSNVNKT